MRPSYPHGRQRSVLLGVLLLAITSAGCGKTERSPNTALSWSDVAERPAPPPGITIAYGTADQQFGELRIPSGKGPFPVAILVHGGCWSRSFDYRYLAHLADRLTDDARIATWLIEYRRLGDLGGGWPGTFLDVAAAADFLRQLSSTYPLEVSRTIAVGHSAGGHLALWLAARHRLLPGSELFKADPLPISSVVGLAPIPDLSAYLHADTGGCSRAVAQLMGGTPDQHPERYRDGSPVSLLPIRASQFFIQGLSDPIVPAAMVHTYATRARQTGDQVELIEQPDAGHFDPAVPDSMSWGATSAAIRSAIRK